MQGTWRCSACRRRGAAIIARGVKVGIEQSEALEGVGFETTVRRSVKTDKTSKLGGRADSETEVLLLAPKASDVRRHSDVSLRDIAKFQEMQSGRGPNASSQRDLSDFGKNEDGTPSVQGQTLAMQQQQQRRVK